MYYVLYCIKIIRVLYLYYVFAYPDMDRQALLGWHRPRSNAFSCVREDQMKMPQTPHLQISLRHYST